MQNKESKNDKTNVQDEDDLNVKGKAAKNMNKKLRKKFEKIKQIARCQSQLEERRERRLKQGLPIFDHENMTYNQFIDSQSVNTQVDAYDHQKHIWLIR